MEESQVCGHRGSAPFWIAKNQTWYRFGLDWPAGHSGLFQQTNRELLQCATYGEYDHMVGLGCAVCLGVFVRVWKAGKTNVGQPNYTLAHLHFQHVTVQQNTSA